MSVGALSRRRNALWYAALVHRLSGLGLAVFLPLHFLTLALAVEDGARLDGFFRFADMPAVKLGETGLVFLLAVHFLGGLRILFVENFTWRGNQAKLASAAGGLAMLLAFVFLIRVL
ncbi:succinate dehydrogenase, cytochrome b subunit [Enterovirga sp.]|jgi:fumarate reductase subunit D|uniref:succinate dehydrogenase, cytochrome b556 subunit n=1 Tax=Enterovirga sp. TaxID=2026350 RepID=UPI0026312A05|nr:succinate dehydrogenase, cytochrome b subunit [Enterovirga sp.]MDB5589628.1 succinate dehydrogenase, cytochrome b subunit [Enterovirga sp.]